MKKMKFGKFGILTLGIAIVSMLMFSLPLMGATADTTTAEDTAAVEETSAVEDLDDVQEEVEEIGEDGDLDEAEEASDADEADENLPGGGHADEDGVDVEHEFEGIE